MKRVQGLLGFIFLTLATIFLGISLFLPSIQAKRWEGMLTASGRIESFQGSADFMQPVISFIGEDGNTYTFAADVSDSSMRNGQQVTVHYILEPDFRAYLDWDFAVLRLVFGIVGAAFLVPTAILLVLYSRKAIKYKRLVRYGTRFIATVTDITERTDSQANGHHPMIVTCKLMNPQGMDEWIMKSDWAIRPSPGLKVGGTVPVLIDQYHPEDYIILAEEASAFPPL